MGEWSFGDMAGHLVGWRNRTINRLEAFANDQPEPPNPWPAELEGDDDAVNDWIHAEHAGRSAEQLVADYDGSYDRMIAALERTPDAKLTDPDALEWVDGALVDADFTDHLHEEHVPSVEAWLSRP
jgi:hypothetical protein